MNLEVITKQSVKITEIEDLGDKLLANGSLVFDKDSGIYTNLIINYMKLSLEEFNGKNVFYVKEFNAPEINFASIYR